MIEGDTAHHLGRVLRAQEGQLYELSDGQRVWLGRIEKVARERVEFALLEEIPAHPPTIDLTLLLSIVKFDAFEWAIEKATELGVSTIVPLAAARSEKGLLAAAGKREAFAARATGPVKILLSEQPDAPSLRQILQAEPPRQQAVLAIGPEGGWTDTEFAAAHASGFREASLGKLILRTETAIVAALASVNYALGE